jgi:hypothetical protein
MDMSRANAAVLKQANAALLTAHKGGRDMPRSRN